MSNALDEFERSLIAASRALHTENATGAGARQPAAGRRRMRRRAGSRRRPFQRRLLVPMFVIVLAAGGVAAAHSILWPTQRLADGTINCIHGTSGQPPALPTEYDGKPVLGLSLNGKSPIAYCRLELFNVDGHETAAGRKAALVACEANPTTVDVYLASGATNQCQADDEKPLPKNYAVAEARLRTLQRDLAKLDTAHNCVSPDTLAREIRSVLTGLGLIGWHLPRPTVSESHGYAIPPGTGGTCGTSALDTQQQKVFVMLVPSHSVQKELQHVSYELYSRSYLHCYTATTIRTLVAKGFATMGMVPRFATVARERGTHYEPASDRLYLAGCVRFSTAWTGNNNKFVDVELVAKGAPRLPPGQFFPPGKDFTS